MLHTKWFDEVVNLQTMLAMPIILVIMSEVGATFATSVGCCFQVHGLMSLQKSFFRECLIAEVTFIGFVQVFCNVVHQVLGVYISCCKIHESSHIVFGCGAFFDVVSTCFHTRSFHHR